LFAVEIFREPTLTGFFGVGFFGWGGGGFMEIFCTLTGFFWLSFLVGVGVYGDFLFAVEIFREPTLTGFFGVGFFGWGGDFRLGFLVGVEVGFVRWFGTIVQIVILMLGGNIRFRLVDDMYNDLCYLIGKLPRLIR
jgi:hypothetical protein